MWRTFPSCLPIFLNYAKSNNLKISSLQCIFTSSETLSEILRGPNSLGSFFEKNLYTALPSSNSPSPEGMRYFSGGYNTYLYGRIEILILMQYS